MTRGWMSGGAMIRQTIAAGRGRQGRPANRRPAGGYGGGSITMRDPDNTTVAVAAIVNGR